jgi:hypothetical protein
VREWFETLASCADPQEIFQSVVDMPGIDFDFDPGEDGDAAWFSCGSA